MKKNLKCDFLCKIEKQKVKEKTHTTFIVYMYVGVCLCEETKIPIHVLKEGIGCVPFSEQGVSP